MSYDSKTLNARSIEIAKAVTGIGKEIHIHLLNLMARVIEHRDVTVCDVFYKAVAKSDKDGKKTSVVRSEAIKKWLMDFGFVSFSTEKPSTLNKAAYNAAAADSFKAHKAKAKVMPWNRYVPEPNAVNSSFDIEALIDRHIKSIIEEMEKAKNGVDRYARQTAKAKAGNNFESDRLPKLVALLRTDTTETANAA